LIKLSYTLFIVGPLQHFLWNNNTKKFEFLSSYSKQKDVGLVTSGDSLYAFYSNKSTNIFNSSGAVQETVDFSVLSNLVHTFEIEDKSYVAFGVHTNSDSSRGSVDVYQLGDDSQMTFVQSLATVGLSKLSTFTSNGESYIAIANDRDFSGDYGTYSVHVDIYVFRTTQNRFELFQTIPAYRAIDVSTHKYGSQTLLAITHCDRSIAVYRLALDLGFLLLEEIRQFHSRAAVFFDEGKECYLAVIVDGVESSKILKLNAIG